MYVVVFNLLGLMVRPWRERTWFKVLFLPGTILAVALQGTAALLCVGVRCKAAPVKDREPSFRFENGRVPCFAGALFVLVSHFLLYAVFLLGVTQLESKGWMRADLVALPSRDASELLAGYIEVDFRGFLAGFRELLEFARANLLVSLGTLYVVAGGFVSLTFSVRYCRWR